MNSITRKCKTCGIEKPIDDFYKHKLCKDGIQPNCKVCIGKAQKEYHKENKESISKSRRFYREANKEKISIQRKMAYAENRSAVIERVKKYSANNKDKISLSRKIYYQINKEVFKLKHLAYRLTHKEESKERDRRYRENNKEYFKAKKKEEKHIRRARVRNAEGSFTIKEWRALCDKYDNKCLCCGEQKPLTVDHVIPISCGGRNSIENLQPLCVSCNSKKHTKVIDYR